jgi:two-component system, OmpR family, sensor kinase
VNGMLDRIEQSIAAQKRLLDDVRHELKTPLTIVRGHLELLDESNPEEVASTRTLAIDELDRMASLVDDIELLAETGFAPPNLEAIEIHNLLAQVHARATALAGHDWSLESDATGILLVDRSRITQAWLQLADNAAKYSPIGSPIVIGTSSAGDSVELWVKDAGPGIPAELQSRIFERFGRVDTGLGGDAGRGIRGSGLGLTIVSSIASSHGGTVTLESSGRGSRFSIVLPRLSDVERDQPAIRTESTP